MYCFLCSQSFFNERIIEVDGKKLHELCKYLIKYPDCFDMMVRKMASIEKEQPALVQKIRKPTIKS